MSKKDDSACGYHSLEESQRPTYSVPEELFDSMLSALRRGAYTMAGTDLAADEVIKELERLKCNATKEYGEQKG